MRVCATPSFWQITWLFINKIGVGWFFALFYSTYTFFCWLNTKNHHQTWTNAYPHPLTPSPPYPVGSPLCVHAFGLRLNPFAKYFVVVVFNFIIFLFYFFNIFCWRQLRHAECGLPKSERICIEIASWRISLQLLFNSNTHTHSRTRTCLTTLNKLITFVFFFT